MQALQGDTLYKKAGPAPDREEGTSDPDADLDPSLDLDDDKVVESDDEGVLVCDVCNEEGSAGDQAHCEAGCGSWVHYTCQDTGLSVDFLCDACEYSNKGSEKDVASAAAPPEMETETELQDLALSWLQSDLYITRWEALYAKTKSRTPGSRARRNDREVVRCEQRKREAEVAFVAKAPLRGGGGHRATTIVDMASKIPKADVQVVAVRLRPK